MHIKNIKNYQDLLRIFKNKMVALTTVDQYDKNYINLLRSDYIILIQNLLEFISHCEDIKLTEISFYYYQLALSNLSILSDDKDILIQHSRNAVLHLNELVKILNNCKESQKLFQFATDSDGNFSIGTFVQIINEDPFIKKFRLLPNKSK